MAGSTETEFAEPFLAKAVLVTGATGFVGRRLVEALLQSGAQVWILRHPDDGAPNAATLFARAAPAASAPLGSAHFPPVELVGDVADAEHVKVAVRQARPRIIFNLAGIVDTRCDPEIVLPTLETNLTGAVNVMMAAHVHGCERLVQVGSSEEIGDGSGVPASPYAASKIAATAYARMCARTLGLSVVVARPFMAYGPDQHPDRLVPYTIRTLLAGEDPHLASGDRVCDFIYVDDVVTGLVACATESVEPGSVIDLGTGVGTPVREVVRLLSDIIGGEGGGRAVFGTRPQAAAGMPHVAFGDPATRLAGWKPRWPLEEGLAATVEAYRSRLGG